MNNVRTVWTSTFQEVQPIEGAAAWPPAPAVRVGMWLAIAAVSMLFLAFTSAYIVRHGLEPDWQMVHMPRLLPVNTVVLLASSVFLELSRRGRSRMWLWATLAAGLLFVAGQFAAWMRMSASGLHFASSAHASFFYTLTALHALHLAGGIMALGWTASLSRVRRRWLDPVAIYWHYMGALWLYLLFLLFGVR